MKVFIGITQNQEKIQLYLAEKGGLLGSLTELGPFLTQEDALRWLNYLKENIKNLEEVTSNTNSSEGSWYGFTFEQV